jgi:ribosomal protein L44E
MAEDNDTSKYLDLTLECANCRGADKIVLDEQVEAPGDKVYPSGTTLCAKCRTPTMVKVYRWTKWKEQA